MAIDDDAKIVAFSLCRVLMLVREMCDQLKPPRLGVDWVELWWSRLRRPDRVADAGLLIVPYT